MLAGPITATTDGKGELSPPAGVVCEEVGKEAALEKAGVQPGDVLISWARLSNSPTNPDPANGVFKSPFDWLWVITEQAPQAPIRIRATRAGNEIVFVVPVGDWESQVRPLMNQEVFSRYKTGYELLRAGGTQEAMALWEELAGDVDLKGMRPWFHLTLGKALGRAREVEKSQEAFRRALKEATDPEIRAVLYSASAQVYLHHNDFDQAGFALQEALKLREKQWGPTLSTAKSIYDLASLALSRQELELAATLAERAVAIQERIASESLDFAASLHLLSRIASARNELASSEQLNLHALSIREKLAPDSLAVASSLNNLAVDADKREDLDASLAAHQRALVIRQRLAPNSQDHAASLSNLGNLAFKRGELEQAANHLKASLAIIEALKPDSPELAIVMENMALVIMARGELDSAAAYLERVLQIRQKLLPNTIYFAMTLNNLGALEFERGDLAKATNYFKRSLQIREQSGADKKSIGASLNNLGNLFYWRGDLAESAKHFQEALDIFQEVRPGSLNVATALTNLGNVFWRRGEPELASEYYTRALEIENKEAPNSLPVAASMINLGNAASDLGDLEAAFKYYQRANEIQEKLSPNSLAVAASLENLGGVSLDRKQTKKAEAYFKRALEIEERLAPRSLTIARNLINLGDVEEAKGNLAEARRYYDLAVALQKTLAPESLAAANGLARLAKVSWRLGEQHTGEQLFARCIDTLEAQIGRLGSSSEARTAFRARYQSHYRDYLDILSTQGRSEDAFHLLERFRARSLLEILIGRDLVFSADLPEALDSALRRIEVQYDLVQEQLQDSAAPEVSYASSSISGRLRELRNKYETIMSEIREASPRFSALRHPRPLSSADARAILDPGALLLSYVVGKDKSYLFIVAPEHSLELVELPVGEDELRRDIEIVSALLQESHRTGTLSSSRSRMLEAASKRLFRVLLQPARAQLDASSRILIVNDGPLHLLPWGSLALDTRGPTFNHRYVAEWRPLSVVLSATMFAELKRLRGALPEGNNGRRIAAFGDPLYLPKSMGDRRPPRRQGIKLEQLPFTGSEVKRIAELFPGVSKLYLGAFANEENAKSIPANSMVHFATHTILDERIPLNSAVALSTPEAIVEGRDNGFLQAWEIFEQVRLNTDLVVLSACESGLGKEMGGEGLIGLTRAFQYAGARSVMASLWKISDRTTAEFMVRFYRHLKEGLPKDEALRATQMEFIRGPIQVTNDKGERVDFDASAPYYWAAFQIYGDWQ